MNSRIITKNYAADQEIGFLKNRFKSPMNAQRPFRQRGSSNEFLIDTLVNQFLEEPYSIECRENFARPLDSFV